MTNCTAVSSHTSNLPFITGDNVYELIPDKYDLTPGTVVTVRCSSNQLKLIGQATFSCGSDGKWSYKTKPYCTDQPVSQPTSGGNTLDQPTKIMIGVVSAVAGLIIIALLIMMITIWYRERRRRKEREQLVELWERDNKAYAARGMSGPPTVDTPMHGHYHGKPPPPDYDTRGHEIRETDRRYQQTNYYPEHRDYRPGYGGHYDDNRRHRRSRSEDSFDYLDRKPYVGDWARRNSSFGSDEYIDRTGVHGDRYRGGRDPYLWRNSYM